MSGNKKNKRPPPKPERETGATTANHLVETPETFPAGDERHTARVVDLSQAKLPAPWIDEISNTIKKAFKEEKPKIVVTTILGSSLLAAILTIAGDWFLVPRRAQFETKTASDAKLAELRLENRNRDLEERRKAYDDLDKELEKTAKILRTYLSTCAQAEKNSTNKAYVEFAHASWDSLTEELKVASDAKNNCLKRNGDDQATFKSVSEILGKLGTNLLSAEVLARKEKNPELMAAHEDIQKAIDDTRQALMAKKSQLILQPEKES